MTNETEQLRALVATLHEALETRSMDLEVERSWFHGVTGEPITEAEKEGIIEDINKQISAIGAALSNTAESARLHDLAVTRKALEDAALIADKHWPESGHVPDEGAVSCAMSISVEIRRLKQEERV